MKDKINLSKSYFHATIKVFREFFFPFLDCQYKIFISSSSHSGGEMCPYNYSFASWKWYFPFFRQTLSNNRDFLVKVNRRTWNLIKVKEIIRANECTRKRELFSVLVIMVLYNLQIRLCKLFEISSYFQSNFSSWKWFDYGNG